MSTTGISHDEIPFITQYLRKLRQIIGRNLSPELQRRVDNFPNLRTDHGQELYQIVRKLREESSRNIFFRDLLTSHLETKKRNRDLLLLLHPDKFPVRGENYEEIVRHIWHNFKTFNKAENLADAGYATYAYHLSEGRKLESTARSLSNVPVLAKDTAFSAIDHYRQACRISFHKRMLKEQIEIRVIIANTFVFCERWLEAQLYVQSAIQIASTSSYDPDKKKSINGTLEERLKKIKMRASGISENVQNTPSSTSSSHEVLLENIVPSSTLEQGMLSIFVADRSLVKKDIDSSNIRIRNTLGKFHQTAAYVYGGTALLAGSGFAVAGGITAYSATSAAAIAGASAGLALLGPIGLVIVGGGAIGFGVYLAYTQVQRSREILDERDIRRLINDRIETAFAHLDRGNHEKFVSQLSAPFEVRGKTYQIFNYTPSDHNFINIDNTITFLLQHGVRPDGIAYILNAVGESLLTGKFSGILTRVLDSHVLLAAQNIFNKIVSSRPLRSTAEELDKLAAEESQNVVRGRRFWNDFNFFLSAGNRGVDVDRNLLEDYEKMTMVERLDEVILVAKLNFNLIYLHENLTNPQNIKLARAGIIEITNEAEDRLSQYGRRPEVLERIEALRDFLVAFGLEDDIERPLALNDSIPPEYAHLPPGLHRDIIKALVENNNDLEYLCSLLKRLISGEGALDSREIDNSSKFELALRVTVLYAESLLKRKALIHNNRAVANHEAAQWNEDIKDYIKCPFKYLHSLMCSPQIPNLARLFREHYLPIILTPLLGRYIELFDELPPESMLSLFQDVLRNSIDSFPSLQVHERREATGVTYSYQLKSDNAINANVSLETSLINFSLSDESCLGFVDFFAPHYFTVKYKSEDLVNVNFALKNFYDLRIVQDQVYFPSKEVLKKLQVKIPVLYEFVNQRPEDDLKAFLRTGEILFRDRLGIRDPFYKKSRNESCKWIYEARTYSNDPQDNEEIKNLIAQRFSDNPEWKEMYREHFLSLRRGNPTTASTNLELIQNLLRNIFLGQDAVFSLVSEKVASLVSVRGNEKQKAPAFFCMGPSGVGKTQIAKAVSQLPFFGGRLMRFDMSSYTNESSLQTIIGSPPGYLGSNNQGLLVQKYYEMMLGGRSTTDYNNYQPVVLLLDEFEKAHATVLKFFLSLFDESYFTARDVNRGNQVQRFEMKNCVIFVTSNAFQSDILQLSHRLFLSEEDYRHPKLSENIKMIRDSIITLNQQIERFPPELIGRTILLPFTSYNKEQFKTIISLKLKEFQLKIMKELGLKLAFIQESEMIELINNRCYDNGIQCRKIDQFIEFNLENFLRNHATILSNFILHIGLKDNHTLLVKKLLFEENIKEEIEIEQFDIGLTL